MKARVRIEHNGDSLGVYAPAISSFPSSQDGIGTPSVHTGLLRDVYLTLISSPSSGGHVTLGVAVNPMIVWLWIGGGVIALRNDRCRSSEPASPSSRCKPGRLVRDEPGTA